MEYFKLDRFHFRQLKLPVLLEILRRSCCLGISEACLVLVDLNHGSSGAEIDCICPGEELVQTHSFMELKDWRTPKIRPFGSCFGHWPIPKRHPIGSDKVE